MVQFYEIEIGSEGFRNGNCNFRVCYLLLYKIVFNYVKYYNK